MGPLDGTGSSFVVMERRNVHSDFVNSTYKVHCDTPRRLRSEAEFSSYNGLQIRYAEESHAADCRGVILRVVIDAIVVKKRLVAKTLYRILKLVVVYKILVHKTSGDERKDVFQV